MTRNTKSLAYKSWFDSLFTIEEKDLLVNIGIEPKADYDILDMSYILNNYKLKKYPELFEKFIDKYIQLIPKFLHSQIDRELLRVDSYYIAWFTSRYCFMEFQRKAKESALGIDRLKSKREYILWSPINDSICPMECLQHKNMIYHVLDEEFIECSIDHWMTVRRGCRCTVIALTESNVRERVINRTCILSSKLKIVFAKELVEAKKNIKTFNQVAYELVFGKFPYYQLYNLENDYLDNDEKSHIRDFILRELQIIVESIDIVKNTHYIDTAQSRLDLARSKLEVILNKNEVFNKTTYEAIRAKLIIEFRLAHTCVYQNIFNKHIEKSNTVKRQATKEKYLNLAKEAIEVGLTDKFADSFELKKLLYLIEKKDKAP